jgi:drug/metabolite transporter (DMT)-like permease
LQASIGIFGVGLGSVGYYFALRRIGAARTSAINVPMSGLAAAAMAWLFLHESIGWLDGVAMVLIACGLVLLWEPDRRTSHARPAGKTPKGS